MSRHQLICALMWKLVDAIDVLDPRPRLILPEKPGQLGIGLTGCMSAIDWCKAESRAIIAEVIVSKTVIQRERVRLLSISDMLIWLGSSKVVRLKSSIP